MKNNKDIEILGNPEDFDVKQMTTPESELLDSEAEEIISEVAEELIKEEEAHFDAKKGLSENATNFEFHKEKERKTNLENALRGLAREFAEKYGKNPTSVQLRTMAKKISG